MSDVTNTFDAVAIARQVAQWAEGEWVQLSRFAVKLRPVDAMDLMMEDGAILDVLREMAQKNIVVRDNDPEAMQKLIEKLPALKPILERVTLAAVGEPKIAENPDPEKGEIPLTAIHLADRLIIFGHVFKEGQTAGIFPGEPAGSVGAVANSEQLRAAARELGRTDPEG